MLNQDTGIKKKMKIFSQKNEVLTSFNLITTQKKKISISGEKNALDNIRDYVANKNITLNEYLNQSFIKMIQAKGFKDIEDFMQRKGLNEKFEMQFMYALKEEGIKNLSKEILKFAKPPEDE